MCRDLRCDFVFETRRFHVDQFGRLAQHQPGETGQNGRFEVDGSVGQGVGVDVIFQIGENARGQLKVSRGRLHLFVDGKVLGDRRFAVGMADVEEHRGLLKGQFPRTSRFLFAAEETSAADEGVLPFEMNSNLVFADRQFVLDGVQLVVVTRNEGVRDEAERKKKLYRSKREKSSRDCERSNVSALNAFNPSIEAE